jgi:APA family basic amino acid/polyamine antiporter
LAAYGGISLVAWLLTTAGALLLALVFARLGRAYPETGGPYAYSRRAFGDFMGFWTAWGYWIAIWAGNAAIAVAFVSYSAEFWPALEANALLGGLVGIAAIWLLTWVNILGVRQGGVMQAVTTVLKLVPLVAIATLGLLFIDTANFTWNISGHTDLQALTAAAALTLWAFIGLESATVPADDLADAQRTIPRSTVIGTLIAAGVYILSTTAVMGVLPADTLASSNAPFADAARAMFGSWAGTAVAAGAVISTFGCLNGWILLQGQVPRAAARDRLFPAAFARLSPNGTPVFGLVASSVLVTVLMAMNYTRGRSTSSRSSCCSRRWRR